MNALAGVEQPPLVLSPRVSAWHVMRWAPRRQRAAEFVPETFACATPAESPLSVFVTAPGTISTWHARARSSQLAARAWVGSGCPRGDEGLQPRCPCAKPSSPFWNVFASTLTQRRRVRPPSLAIAWKASGRVSVPTHFRVDASPATQRRCRAVCKAEVACSDRERWETGRNTAN